MKDHHGNPVKWAPDAGAGAAGARLRPQPLYEQVKREITELILTGAWARGSQIPGEEQLARQYGVSVGTIRRALGELANEGLVARRRRLGTVVSDRSPHHSMRFHYHYYRLHREDGELVRSQARVLSVERASASEREAEALKLSRAWRRVIRVRRVRRIDGQPSLHEVFVVPEHRFPDFPEAADLPELIYVFYEERYGVRLVAARESLRADVAGTEDRALLEVAEGHPILEIEQVAYDTSNAAVEWRLCRALTDGFRYVNEIR